MRKVFEAKIKLKRLPLGSHAICTLKDLGRFDVIAFTSKNAQLFFAKERRERKLRIPNGIQIVRVGPRKDLLELDTKGRRVLLPRSAAAPFDIVKKLRARGAKVTMLKLYEPLPVPLTVAERRALFGGDIKELYFKSPSAIQALLGQLSAGERRIIKGMPVRCIGETTATAARALGFRKVAIKRL